MEEALTVVGETLTLPVPERTRRVLEDHLRYLSVLGGTEPVPSTTLIGDEEPTLNGLVAEALRCSLIGQTGIGLEYAWSASRLAMSEGVDPNEGASADIWPPYLELIHHGPDAALAALVEVIELREQRGGGWQTAGHQSIGAAIDFTAGRLDDAAAQYDSSLELAERTELGWTSQSVGIRAHIDVLRGRVSDAVARLDAWDAAPGPSQLGIPAVERARIAATEANRHYREAADLARTVWERAGEYGVHVWRATVAPELARVALRAADDGLLQAIHDGLAAAPALDAAPATSATRLALAMTGPSYGDVVAVAERVRGEAAACGAGQLQLTAMEEVAVAEASTGDRDRARFLAHEAIALAQDFGAAGVEARIAGRMRALGVRLGATAGRARPTYGWDSLTPTEGRVVGLVVGGSTGPEIARQLHVSPRTVQTHVSHALAKLGVANRMELVAAASRRI